VRGKRPSSIEEKKKEGRGKSERKKEKPGESFTRFSPLSAIYILSLMAHD
jgi:hypothetical protein